MSVLSLPDFFCFFGLSDFLTLDFLYVKVPAVSEPARVQMRHSKGLIATD